MGPVRDTNKRISEVFGALEKRWHKCIISEWGYFEEDNKYLLKKFKITVIFLSQLV